MIEIIKGTAHPLSDMGVAAGICWHAPIDDVTKNIHRAIDCIESGHGRVEEYPDVTVEISEYSARCIRELYTHIIGTSRLQESTRYVDCENFTFYEPDMDDAAKKVYEDFMKHCKETYTALVDMGVSKEDAANVLPLGMHTRIVLKINVRALEHFANMRLCTRAYKEIRTLAKELKKVLAHYSPEWKTLTDAIMVPKCVKDLYCTEKKCCGKAPKKSTVAEALKFYKEHKAEYDRFDDDGK